MISKLPVETLLRITHYLSVTEKISLALAQPVLFKKLATSGRSLDFQKCYDVQVPVLKEYVAKLAFQITEVNFSNCFWIDSDGLLGIITCLPSAEKLQLHGTQLTCKHLLSILQSCNKLTHLSISIDGFDSSFWKLEPSYETQGRQTCIHGNSIFYDFRDSLARFTHLQLFSDTYCTVMLTVLLSFCTCLEKLHIEFSSRYVDTFTEKILNNTSLILKELSTKQPSYPDLRSLTCIINGNVDMYIIPDFLRCLLHAKDSKLNAFWVPEMCANKFVSRKANFNDFTDSLTNLKGDYELRQLIDQVPHLKLLSGICDHPRVFSDFARNHNQLEELQLKVIHYDVFCHGRLNGGFEHLTRLKRLCVSPELLSGSELTHLTRSCSKLEELEIADWSCRRRSCPMKSDALSSLTKCSELKYLTLSGINVSGPSLFLLKIFTECSKLKSLRLVNITGQQIVNQMICSISDAPNLTDFRLEMADMDDLEPLLQSMNQMVSLRRWVIFAPSLQNLETLNCVVQDWPALVLACLIIPYADPSHVTSLKIVSKHPAFRWCFGTSIKDAETLPDVHYDDLISFGSNVCKRPIF